MQKLLYLEISRYKIHLPQNLLSMICFLLVSVWAHRPAKISRGHCFGFLAFQHLSIFAISRFGAMLFCV